jgi:hypothetical protein
LFLGPKIQVDREIGDSHVGRNRFPNQPCHLQG